MAKSKVKENWVMFEKDATSQILGFVNSIVRANKITEYRELIKEALRELDSRSSFLTTVYFAQLKEELGEKE